MAYYIGIANTSHDPAVAILDPQGKVLFAEGMERYFQVKRAWDLPPDHGGRIRDLINRYCDPNDEFVIASSWKTLGLFEKQAGTPQDQPPKSAGQICVGFDDRQKGNLFRESDIQWLTWSQKKAFDGCGKHLQYMFCHYLNNQTIRFQQFDHHLTHAATACYTSPYKKALCLIVDGEGEIGSTSSYCFDNGKLKRQARSWGVGSLGAFYAKITELCGYDWRKGEEGKIMGLAAFGKPWDQLSKCLSALIHSEGCHLYFPKESDIEKQFIELRKMMSDTDVNTLFTRENLAFNGQMVFESVMTQLLNDIYKPGFSSNLVLGGGCALNSSFNGKILEQTPFSSVHVPCAPGDDGNALGAAILAFMEDNPDSIPQDNWQSAFHGSSIDHPALSRLNRFCSPGLISHHPGSVHQKAANLISQGHIIGWVQDQAEFGPRSLGNRSILADPCNPGMKDRINAMVKFREPFRPFAPSIMADKADDWFHKPLDSPYMSFTRPWKPSMTNRVPAVVHRDGTGRLQTVTKQSNQKFYDLISEFHKITNVPVLLNTSFNIMGKPIIHSLEDAMGMFFTTGMDALVIGDTIIRKTKI